MSILLFNRMTRLALDWMDEHKDDPELNDDVDNEGEHTMSQAPTPTQTTTPAATPTPKPRDGKLAFALLLTDWLHGDRHHQARLMELALALLDDLGDDGAEAKERLTGMHEPPKAANNSAKPADTKAA